MGSGSPSSRKACKSLQRDEGGREIRNVIATREGQIVYAKSYPWRLDTELVTGTQ